MKVHSKVLDSEPPHDCVIRGVRYPSIARILSSVDVSAQGSDPEVGVWENIASQLRFGFVSIGNVEYSSRCLI